MALTRARHQAVVWWATSFGSRESPLARLLFASDGSSLATAPSEQQVVDRVQAIAAAAPGTISVERCTGGTGARWAATEIAGGELAVRTFDRTLDSGWRRTSYTALTSDLHDADVASEPEDAGITDEQVPTGPAPAAVPAADTEGLRSVSLPLAAMAGGARVGSLVHAVLEHVDFAAPDLTDVVAAGLAEQLAWSRIDIGPVDSVVDGLVAAIETPLGPIVGDARLRDVGRADRLDELGFELPARRRRHAGCRADAGGARRRARRPRRRRRPAGRLRDPAARPATAPAAARLPQRQPRPRRPPRRRRRHGRGSPSSTTSPTGSASRARS